MLSESFPILGMVYFAVYAGRLKTARTWLVISLVLLGFFVVQMLFGGLRGSRSNTIWALFWAAGIIHFWIRPLNRRFVFVGICFLVVFMYVYGFYKDLGGDTLTAFEAGEIPAEVSIKTRRTLDVMHPRGSGASRCSGIPALSALTAGSGLSIRLGRNLPCERHASHPEGVLA